MKKLFGTDGIRGKANSYPITAELALQLGKATAHVFGASGKGEIKAVLGKDTRLSGYMLENAIISGMLSMGMDVMVVGPMPTPAVAHLTRSFGAACGIMITASHNPAEDNGIKIFGGDGFKLADEVELDIESHILSGELNTEHIGNKLLTTTGMNAPSESSEARPGGSQPEKLELHLIIDGTGAANWGLPIGLGARAQRVKDQIDAFKTLCYNTDGGQCAPHAVEIKWGDVIRDNYRLQSADITYKSFDRNAAPLRAELDFGVRIR